MGKRYRLPVAIALIRMGSWKRVAMPVLAIIVPPNRRFYEECYFNSFGRLKVRAIVGAPLSPQSGGSPIEFVTAGSRTSPVLGRVFKTVMSPVRYTGLNSALADVDAVMTIEVYSPLSAQFVRFAKETGKKSFVIVWETLPFHPFYWLPPFGGTASWVAREADGFVATSLRSAAHLEKRNIGPERTQVIYPGVDADLFRPSLHADDVPQLLYVGLLAEHKGFRQLLSIYAEIRKRRKMRLSVVGDGPQRHLLSTELGKDVKYYGRVSNADLPKVYSQSSIFVSFPHTVRHLGMKTWEEQFGFTLVEAMASGLPVVSTECGAVREIVDDANPIVPEDSTAAARDAILKLVENPTQAREIGVVNRKRVEKLFDAKSQSRKLEEYLLANI